jgi:hypothetical protein
MRASVLGASTWLENEGEGGGLVLLVGVTAVRLVDWFVLAYDKPAASPPTDDAARLRPTFLVSERKTEIGFSGTF